METLSYKPNAGAVVERLRRLYARQAQDEVFASFEIPNPALDRFAAQHPTPFCDYPDPHERVRFWQDALSVHATLEDDSVPCAYLSEFDQGLYGGLVGGDVRFVAHPENGWVSSMVPPLLKAWSDFDRLPDPAASPWLECYRSQLKLFVEGARGRFGVSHFIMIDSLNFVYELVGATATYTALTDEPEMVHRAVDFAYDLNLMVQRMFFEHVPLFQGGTVSNMAQWIPGRIVSESVDPYHMTSVRYFETWGREPVERMLANFDGGVMHLHGNGRHLLEAVASISKLKALYLGDDRGYPEAADVLPKLRQRAATLPFVTQIPYAPFIEKLERHELTGGVFYKVKGAPDAGSANRAMERVRAYRA
jgi:hypothetical protein